MLKSSIGLTLIAIQLHKYTLPISIHMGQCMSYETHILIHETFIQV